MSNNDFLLEAEKPLDLRLLLHKYLLRFWWLYIIGILLAGTGAWLYLRYTTPQFLVRSTILIKTPESSTGDVSQEFILGELGLTPPGGNVENEMQILKSRSLMMEVVRHLHLDVVYESEGRIKRGEQYMRSPVLLAHYQLREGLSRGLNFFLEPHEQDSMRFYLQVGEQTPTEVYFDDTLRTNWGQFVFTRNPEIPKWSTEGRTIIRIVSPEGVAQKYASKVQLKRIGEWSSVIEMSLKDPVPQKAADILNTLAQAYNEASIQDKNRVASNTYKFINERLKSFTAELSESEGELEAFKTRNTIPGDIGMNVSTFMDEFKANDAELARLQLQVDVVNNLEAILSESNTTFDLLPANFAIENADLNGQTERYNELQLERRRRLRAANESHPSILEINERISALRTVIMNTLKAVRADLNRRAEVLRRKNARLQGSLRSIPGIERELIEITRQKNIKENLYLYLLQKREEAAISMAVAAPNSRVLDAAQPSGGPIEPKRQIAYALAVLLGLGIPLGIAVLADLLNDSVQTPDDIKNATAAPIAGVIGHSRSGKQLVVDRSSRSAIAEMFRLLRANLQFLHPGQDSQVWVVTSGASGEGKSFVTLNLGMTLAIGGKKVVLIGMDLRKPKLQQYIGIEASSSNVAGVTNYLISGATIEEVIHPTTLHNMLYFIPSGPIPPNPAELLLQERTAELFAYLRQRFDYIIIDTPPVGLVSDALLLNPHVTGALYLIRQGLSKKGTLQLLDDLYQNKKLHNIAIVFNGVGSKGSYYGYGYGYFYGYGYEYGYGYYEDEKKSGKKKQVL